MSASPSPTCPWTEVSTPGARLASASLRRTYRPVVCSRLLKPPARSFLPVGLRGIGSSTWARQAFLPVFRGEREFRTDDVIRRLPVAQSTEELEKGRLFADRAQRRCRTSGGASVRLVPSPFGDSTGVVADPP